MSTTPSELPAGRQYVNFEEFIDYHLHRTRSQFKVTDIATACVLCGLGLASYLLLFVVMDQWVIPGGWPVAARIGMLGVVVGAMTWLIARRVVRPLTRSVNALYAAREIEKTDPKLKGTLLAAVDLQGVQLSEEDRKTVVRAIEKRAALGLQSIDVEQAVNRLPLLRLSYGLLGIVAISCLYVVLSPKDPFVSVRRALLPTSELQVATRTTISNVSPGDQTLPARSMLDVEADIRGRNTGPVHLVYTTADRSFVDQPVEMRRIDEGLPRFRGSITGPNGKGILQDLTWRIQADDAQTVDYRLTIVQPPSATVNEIKYVHPQYMELPPRTAMGGTIDGWEGSQVTLSATANMPVKSAVLQLFDTEDGYLKGDRGEQIAVRVNKGTELSASWALGLRADGTYARFYRLQVETSSGARDPEPAQYSIKIRPDQAPEVALLHPTSDLERPLNVPLPLAIQASDADFGLRTVTLKSEKNGEGMADVRLFEDRLPSQAIRADYEWDIARHGLKVGDVVQFWIEVRDSKQPVANRKVTNRLNLKIVAPVSPEAAREQLVADKAAQQDQLAQADPQMRDPENGDPQPPEADNKPPRDDNSPAPEPAAARQPADARPENTDPKQNGEPKEPSPPETEPTSDDPQPDKGNGADEKRPADDAEALERFIRQIEEEQRKRQPGNEPKDDGDSKPSADNPEEPGRHEKQPATEQPDAPGKAPRERRDNPRNSGQPDNSQDAKNRPTSNPSEEQPGREDDNRENNPSKRNDPAESKKVDPAGKGKAPTQQRERPGTDDATGANAPMPSNSGEPTDKPSRNEEGPEQRGGKPGDARNNSTKSPREQGEGGPGTKRENDPQQKPKEGTTPEIPGEEKPGKSMKNAPGRGEKGQPSAEKPGVNPEETDAGSKPQDVSASKTPGEQSKPDVRNPDSGKSESAPNQPAEPGDKSKPGTTREPGSQPDNNKGQDPSEKNPRGDKNATGEKSPASAKNPGANEKNKTPGQKSQPEAKPDPMNAGPNGAANDSVKPDDATAEKPAGDQTSDRPDDSSPGKKPMPGEKSDAPKAKNGKPESKGAEKGEDGVKRPAGKPEPGTDQPSDEPGKDPKPGHAPGEKTTPASKKPTPPPESGEAKPADNQKAEDKPGKSKGNGKPASSEQADSSRPERGPAPKSEDEQPSDGPSSAKPSKPSNQKGDPKAAGEEKNDGQGSGQTGSKPGEGKTGKPQNSPGSAESPSSEGQPSATPGDKQSQPGQGKSGQGEKGKTGDSTRPDAKGNGKSADPNSEGTEGPSKTPGQPSRPEAKPGSAPNGSERSDKAKDVPQGDKPGVGKPGTETEGPQSDQGSGEKPDGKGGDMPGDQPGSSSSKQPGGEGEEASSGKGGEQPGQSPEGKGAGKGGSDSQPSAAPGGKGGRPGSPGEGPRKNPKAAGQTGESQGTDVDRRGEGGNASDDNPSGERPEPVDALTADEQAEAAKLEYARKATDLVLNRIQDQLERGEVDQKTLDELGWTKADLERFADRLKQRKQTADTDDGSPEAIARKMQFEEELKQLRVGNDIRKRSESGGAARRTTIGNKLAPVPPELRDQYDAYTRGLSKSKSAPTAPPSRK